VASAALLGLAAWLGKHSAAAARARAQDEVEAKGDEALP
jgi:hypothetical protein